MRQLYVHIYVNPPPIESIQKLAGTSFGANVFPAATATTVCEIIVGTILSHSKRLPINFLRPELLAKIPNQRQVVLIKYIA